MSARTRICGSTPSPKRFARAAGWSTVSAVVAPRSRSSATARSSDSTFVTSETTAGWTAFLRSLVARGLSGDACPAARVYPCHISRSVVGGPDIAPIERNPNRHGRACGEAEVDAGPGRAAKNTTDQMVERTMVRRRQARRGRGGGHGFLRWGATMAASSERVDGSDCGDRALGRSIPAGWFRSRWC